MFEIINMMRDGLYKYIVSDPFNILDVLSFILNNILIARSVWRDDFEFNEERNRGLAAVACIIMWYKLFGWLRLSSKTSFYIRLLVETISDIRYFMVLFVLILFTFGNAILILGEDRKDSDG